MEHVFAYLGQADNARNSRVCRSWKEAASAALWRKIDVRAFGVLVNLKIVSESVSDQSHKTWVCFVCFCTGMITDIYKDVLEGSTPF